MLLCICFRKWNCRSEISRHIVVCIFITFGHALYFQWRNIADWWCNVNWCEFSVRWHVKHSAIVCLWNWRWRTRFSPDWFVIPHCILELWAVTAMCLTHGDSQNSHSADGLGMRQGVGWPILVSWYIALDLCNTFVTNDFEKVLDYTSRIGWGANTPSQWNGHDCDINDTLPFYNFTSSLGQVFAILVHATHMW